MERETKLTPEYLKTVSKKFDLNTIFLLQIISKGVSSLGSIPSCENLLILDLSHNKILMLNGINTWYSLTYLNISYNKISQLDPLKSCKELQTLMAEGNKVKDVRTVETLDGLKKLSSLYLQEFSGEGANPIWTQYGYVEDVIAALPQLALLDGQMRNQPKLLDPDESELKAEMPDCVTDDKWYSDEMNRGYQSNTETASNTREVKTAEMELRGMLDEFKSTIKMA